MKRLIHLSLLGALVLGASFFSVTGFEDSIHYTRNGKKTWYDKDNGGFEMLTGIPMDSLSCLNCHAATYADGTPVDGANYEPGCADCHDFPNGQSVAQATCLGCHGRQGAEIGLEQNPVVGHLYTDVHREAGMVCTDCHTSGEMHGDDIEYLSMFEDGVTEARCTNEGCHPPGTGKVAANPSHDIHDETVECIACHAKTVTTCYNCHFETEIEIQKKRFYGPPPMGGFVMLVNRERNGLVTTASFQSVTLGDTAFYAVGPFTAHTISKEARGCDDCHQSKNVVMYNDTGEIPVVQWDSTTSLLVANTGMIPAPPDWATAWQLDFVRYLGDSSGPVEKPRDPTKWEFMKDHADLAQMLYASPLTEEQMAKLSANVTANEDGLELPSRITLEQNYPNPFNPATTISFHLTEAAHVSLVLYDALGREVQTILPGQMRTAGRHGVFFDASDLSSGTYVYRLEGDGIQLAKTLTVMQ